MYEDTILKLREGLFESIVLDALIPKTVYIMLNIQVRKERCLLCSCKRLR